MVGQGAGNHTEEMFKTCAVVFLPLIQKESLLPTKILQKRMKVLTILKQVPIVSCIPCSLQSFRMTDITRRDVALILKRKYLVIF